jgi:ABC-2 type transport system permease protein
VARTAVTERLVWRADVAVEILFSGATVLLAWLLWRAVFAGRAELEGFTLGAMTSYYLVATFAWQLDQSDGYGWELAYEIRSGSFGKYLTRPIDPLHWYLAVCAGRTAMRAGLVLAAAALWALPFSTILVAPSALGILASIPVIVLGLTAFALLNFMTALLAMVMQDPGPFHMICGILIQFLSGGLIPLAILPGWARGILDLTPFPAMASLPAMLWLGRGIADVPRACLVTGAWVVILVVAAKAAYRGLSRRYEEVGG